MKKVSDMLDGSIVKLMKMRESFILQGPGRLKADLLIFDI